MDIANIGVFVISNRIVDIKEDDLISPQDAIKFIEKVYKSQEKKLNKYKTNHPKYCEDAETFGYKGIDGAEKWEQHLDMTDEWSNFEISDEGEKQLPRFTKKEMPPTSVFTDGERKNIVGTVKDCIIFWGVDNSKRANIGSKTNKSNANGKGNRSKTNISRQSRSKTNKSNANSGKNERQRKSKTQTEQPARIKLNRHEARPQRLAKLKAQNKMGQSLLNDNSDDSDSSDEDGDGDDDKKRKNDSEEEEEEEWITEMIKDKIKEHIILARQMYEMTILEMDRHPFTPDLGFDYWKLDHQSQLEQEDGLLFSMFGFYIKAHATFNEDCIEQRASDKSKQIAGANSFASWFVEELEEIFSRLESAEKKLLKFGDDEFPRNFLSFCNPFRYDKNEEHWVLLGIGSVCDRGFGNYWNAAGGVRSQPLPSTRLNQADLFAMTMSNHIGKGECLRGMKALQYCASSILAKYTKNLKGQDAKFIAVTMKQMCQVFRKMDVYKLQNCLLPYQSSIYHKVRPHNESAACHWDTKIAKLSYLTANCVGAMNALMTLTTFDISKLCKSKRFCIWWNVWFGIIMVSLVENMHIIEDVIGTLRLPIELLHEFDELIAGM